MIISLFSRVQYLVASSQYEVFGGLSLQMIDVDIAAIAIGRYDTV